MDWQQRMESALIMIESQAKYVMRALDFMRRHELAFALDVAGPLLADLERWFALAYPYGKLDHVAAGDFSGAYEDAGAILYGADQLHIRHSRYEYPLCMGQRCCGQCIGRLKLDGNRDGCIESLC